MGWLCLITAFNYSLFFILQIVLGITGTGTLFKVYSVAILAVVLIVFIMKILGKTKFTAKQFAALCICAAVVALFYLTRYKYSWSNSTYETFFVSMGVRFVPAVLMGIVMSTDDTIMDKVKKCIWPFMMLYTLTVAYCIFSVQVGALGDNMLAYNQGDGMSYQALSYYAAYAFGLNMFYLCSDECKKSPVRRSISLALIIVQLVCTMSAGGRGGFVLFMVFAAYFALSHMSSKQLLRYAAIAIAMILVFVLLIQNERIQHGFSRISTIFDSDAVSNDNRWIRYGLAVAAFAENVVFGNGIGSVFYELDLYSHNMFTDMLCEGGLLLTVPFVVLLAIFFSQVWKQRKTNENMELITVIFLCSFVFLMFSTYYLSESAIWLAMTYVLCRPKRSGEAPCQTSCA